MFKSHLLHSWLERRPSVFLGCFASLLGFIIDAFWSVAVYAFVQYNAGLRLFAVGKPVYLPRRSEALKCSELQEDVCRRHAFAELD